MPSLQRDPRGGPKIVDVHEDGDGSGTGHPADHQVHGNVLTIDRPVNVLVDAGGEETGVGKEVIRLHEH